MRKNKKNLTDEGEKYITSQFTEELILLTPIGAMLFSTVPGPLAS